ncbi:hypothetical protein J6P92_00735 [bacterium]|nr:hypothetical protein [bacterium]
MAGELLNGILPIGKQGGTTKGSVVGHNLDKNAKNFKFALGTPGTIDGNTIDVKYNPNASQNTKPA